MAKDLIERWIEESKGLEPVRSRKMTPEEQKRWKEKKKNKEQRGKGTGSG